MHKSVHSRSGATSVSALGRPMAIVSLLALCVSAFAGPAHPAAAKAKPARKNPIKRIAARIVHKPVRKPPPPAAEIPVVAESASVWRGCLESQDLPKLALSLGIESNQLSDQLGEMNSNQTGGCTAYVAATGGDAGSASVIFRHTEQSGESHTLAFHKSSEGIVATPGVCDCRESTRRFLNLPAREFTESLNTISASIPANIRWQLNILVPHMISEKAESPADTYNVRIAIGRFNDDEQERLESVEILEQGSEKRINGAWWLDRPDGPGVIIGMDGVAYERLLWDSPVKYTRSSRGVGASVTTYRRRVPAKKGSGAKTVVQTINVPAYHLGVDMSAAKGTDVHAVGDAKVSFAGRQGGFGNLIILDHGRGYQTYYAHLSKIEKGIKIGAKVARGDTIGLVGSTGHSTAPHLHFETRKDGRYLDPFDQTRQLGFWLLTADEQERLAMQLLAVPPTIAVGDQDQHDQDRRQ